MTATVIVRVDGLETVLDSYEVEAMLEALRRDRRVEEQQIHQDRQEFSMSHRVNAGLSQKLLQLINPKHSNPSFSPSFKPSTCF